MMRLNSRVFLAFALCFVVTELLVLPIAKAHAVLLESNPPLNGQVAGANVPIKLRFNVRIDAARSRITLVGPDGSSQALQIGESPKAETLTSQAAGLAPGSYKLRWQVLASDGHLTRGEIPFTVVKS
jgi:copper resistance protein C